MNTQSRARSHGFNRLEILVIVAVFAVLAFAFLADRKKQIDRAKRISCLGNLKQVGLSFRQWALDHQDAFPMSLSTNRGGTLEHVGTGEVWRHFQVMSNELNTPVILGCHSDRDRVRARHFTAAFSNTNISYFVGVDANETMPQMFLTGDRNLEGGTRLPNRMLQVTSNDTVSWSKGMHRHQGNVGLSDGSVQGFSSLQLQEALLNTGVATNRLAFP
ncbi:MAG: type II secretion system protein [Verrucomicrobia bacterium]|nr:type II secretion system protein [Verrucomicrobiota bacterium]